MFFLLLNLVFQPSAGTTWFTHPMSRTGRAIEAFTPEQRDSFNPIVGRYIEERGKMDEVFDFATPRIFDGSMNEVLEYEKITIGNCLIQSYNSLVFEIDKDHAIIYMHDCDRDFNGVTHVPHPLLVEAAFTNEAARLGVAKPFLFVSPPALLPLDRTSAKLFFSMTPAQYEICVFNGGTVRYAIIGRQRNVVGLELIRTRPSAKIRQTLSRAARIGGTLIQALRVLHRRQIVHGNLNFNVAGLEKVSDRSMRLVLSDFVHASWINGTVSPTNQGSHRYIDFSEMSPWELENGFAHFVNTRDEVFRAVQMVAAIILGDEYLEQQRNMTREALIEWKKSGNLFTLPMNGRIEFLNSMNFSDAESVGIKIVLQHIQYYARMDGVPDYDRLAELFHFVDKQTRSMKAENDSLPHSSVPTHTWLVPRLDDGDAPEMSPVGELVIGNPSQNAQSNRLSFWIPSTNAKMILYFHDCDGNSTRSVHPATSAFHGYLGLSKMMLGLMPMWLSHAAPLPRIRTRKTNFLLTDSEYENCVDAKTTVRYLVLSFESLRHPMLRVPVENFIRTNRMNFTEAMSIGATLVFILKQMHTSGMIHGNLDRRQFSLHKLPDQDFAILALHGFGGDAAGSVWMSPWEIESANSTYTKKDDLYRVIEMVAAILNGPEYDTTMSRLTQDKLVLFKKTGFLFANPSRTISDILAQLRLDIRRSTMTYFDLGGILAHVRKTDPESINYDLVINLFQRLAKIENSPKKTSNKRQRDEGA